MDHVDVLIVGAGLSGIGAAAHLRRECPDRSVAIVESRDSIGGTWDLFRYPGVRSDSDMFTMAYAFRPWHQSTSLAAGADILAYLQATVEEYRLEEQIRFNHRVLRADWHSADARWTVQVQHTDTAETTAVSCSFLVVCAGYYRYDAGYRPDFPGADEFTGRIVHPQHWPSDLDVAGKQVTVIGSGATAVTLVPALAGTAAHVTMLQRSPSYILSMPSTDPLARRLPHRLPAGARYAVIRWKNILITWLIFRLSRRRPELLRRWLLKGVTGALPAGYDVDTHFNPAYNPWDQRLCLVPNGDLFRAIRHGEASVLTDTIERFTPTGIRLTSGTELAADVIVTATGLDVQPLGGLPMSVDGRDVELSERVAYKGMMLSEVPNAAFVLGYASASWTLRADLIAGYLCRLLNHMRENGFEVATPGRPPASMPTRPIIDLRSGYILRSRDRMPRQGTRGPWRVHQSYPRDVIAMRLGRLGGRGIRFAAASRAGR